MSKDTQYAVLLVQTAFLGDVVLSTPLIRAIKKRHPLCKLYVLTTPGGKELLEHDPEIEQIIVLDKQAKSLFNFFKIIKIVAKYNFKIVYSLHKSYRTALMLWLARIPIRVGFKQAKLSFLYTHTKSRPKNLHDVERNLALLDSVKDNEKELVLFYSHENLDLPKDYLVIAPGSVWQTKRWSVKHFKNLTRLLSTQYTILIVGSKNELKLSQYLCNNLDGSRVLNLTGKLSLNQLIQSIALSSAVICNDSLPLHIASAFKKSVIALFCATSPTFGFGPYRTKSIVLEDKFLSCKPCLAHGSNFCPTGTQACRYAIQPEDVANTLKFLLN